MDDQVAIERKIPQLADRRQRARVHAAQVIERGRPNFKAVIPELAELVRAVDEREEEKE